MVPVINVPIDMRACFQQAGQRGWMDAKATFVPNSVYRHKFDGSEELETKIRRAVEDLYTVSGHQYYPQEDTFESDINKLNNLYERYKQEAANSATQPQMQRPNSFGPQRPVPQSPAPPQRPVPQLPAPPPVFQQLPQRAAPSFEAAEQPRITKYLAQKERLYIREGSIVDPQYKRVSQKVYHVCKLRQKDGQMTPHFYEGRIPWGGVVEDNASYYLFEKQL
jgi:hypothetical protein